jgi:hypothetical protein
MRMSSVTLTRGWRKVWIGVGPTALYLEEVYTRLTDSTVRTY